MNRWRDDTYKCFTCHDTSWVFPNDASTEVVRCPRCYGPAIGRPFGERE